MADYLSEGDSSLPHNITDPRSSLAVTPATGNGKILTYPFFFIISERDISQVSQLMIFYVAVALCVTYLPMVANNTLRNVFKYLFLPCLIFFL